MFFCNLNYAFPIFRWFISIHPTTQIRVSLPQLPFGDIYRSMTILPNVYSHYYPADKGPEIQWVTEDEYEGQFTIFEYKIK